MLEPHLAPPACVTEDAFAALMEITRRPPDLARGAQDATDGSLSDECRKVARPASGP